MERNSSRPCLREVILEEKPCSRYGPYRTCYTHEGCLESDTVIEIDPQEETEWMEAEESCFKFKECYLASPVVALLVFHSLGIFPRL